MVVISIKVGIVERFLTSRKKVLNKLNIGEGNKTMQTTALKMI